MNRKVLDTIKKYDMLREGQSVVCGVSGGADSMALLVLLCELSESLCITVSAAHLNHLLRGAEADRDESFVRQFCAKNKIPLCCERADVAKEAALAKKGIEEAARDARYAFFERARLSLGADLTATAHTANDNLETMLINLSRGTGLLGLCGIPPKRGRIIRPLIRAERVEIEAYLKKRGIAYVTDSTNLENGYLRNKMRNFVVPELVKICPAVLQSAGAAADALRLDADFIMTEARKIVKGAREEGDGVSVSTDALGRAHPAVSGRAVRLLYEKIHGKSGQLTMAHVSDVFRLCAGSHPSKRLSLPGKITAERRYGALVLSKNPGSAQEIKEIPLLFEGKYDIYGTDYSAEYKKAEKDQKIYNLSHSFLIDCGKINGCLVIRSRKEGDTLKLPGYKTKTLKKLFIEEKIPLRQRALIPVVADKTHVVAVYGFGVDHNYQAKSPENAVYLKIGSVNDQNEGRH